MCSSILSSLATDHFTNKKKNVGVICSTYRDPKKPSLTRLYGIASLIDQCLNQEFDGNISVFIVDDSPEPHPFLQGLSEKLQGTVFYFHLPERNNLPANITNNYPTASRFFPKDSDFKNDPFWIDKIAQVESWKHFLPFDYEFAKTFSVDMLRQVTDLRPTIGMKKNFACGAYQDHFQKLPDTFIYVDDDDFRSPEYISRVVDGIKGANFARMTQTYVHNISENPKNKFWAEVDFQVSQDHNGNWYIPNDVMNSDCFKFEDGKIIKRPVSDLYARNLLLAWPIISHDGALHSYTGETWGKAAKEFGGFFPTSFSEDIITHKMMHQLSGFKTAKIDVSQPHFLRCSDGNNCSDFYVTKTLGESVMPQWVHDSLSPLYEALELGRDPDLHHERLIRMGKEFGKKGNFKLSSLQP